MTPPPVIAFSAWSGTGKTTIIEKLICCLKEKGLRVAAVKHDAHQFEIDREGKDSWRFSKAGADITIITSADKTAMIEQRPRELSDVLTMVHDVDLIIAEGFQQAPFPKIGISRSETGKGFRLPISSYIALITDENPDTIPGAADAASPLPIFGPEDIASVASFLIGYFHLPS